MLTGGCQPRAIPPCTPERAAPTTPKLVDSAYESPASRRLLRRVRTGGVEGEWRTKGNSGEQKLGISHAKVASFRAGRKRHNTKLAERVDPTAAPPPPPLPIEHIPGSIGRPPQDKYLLPPLKLTRSAAAKGWDLPEARPKGFGLGTICVSNAYSAPTQPPPAPLPLSQTFQRAGAAVVGMVSWAGFAKKGGRL